MKLQDTFLYRLYHEDKIFFAVVAILILGTLYYSSRSREEFPFLLYGMYSLKEEPQNTFTTYSIEIDGQQLRNSIYDAKRQLILSTLSNAAPQIIAGQMTNEQQQYFANWIYSQYFMPIGTTPYSQRNIYQSNYIYDANARPQLLKKELLYSNGRK